MNSDGHITRNNVYTILKAGSSLRHFTFLLNGSIFTGGLTDEVRSLLPIGTTSDSVRAKKFTIPHPPKRIYYVPYWSVA